MTVLGCGHLHHILPANPVIRHPVVCRVAAEEKAALLAEVEAAVGKARPVARRHGILESLLAGKPEGS
jgi:hypothetical protein